MHTTHWTWASQPVEVAWRDEPVSTGKANVLNNFCIGIQSNWTGCTKCHAGYGWSDANFDFSQKLNVDCLVCHEQTGNYVKGNSGVPVEGVDLVSAAQSVAMPTRANCGYCHFNGGGGDAVKHGDMDTTLINPAGKRRRAHGPLRFPVYRLPPDRRSRRSKGARSRSASTTPIRSTAPTVTNQTCTTTTRINAHTDTVACQTCHVPAGAVRQPTKMEWDWSAAGQDIAEDPHEYLKIKGSFIYEANIMPDYAWHNGTVARYLLGDPIDPTQTTVHEPAARQHRRSELENLAVQDSPRHTDLRHGQQLPAPAADRRRNGLLDHVRLGFGRAARYRKRSVWTTAASTASRRQRCTGRSVTWSRPPIRPCSAAVVTAKTGGWTGKRWVTTATRCAGVDGMLSDGYDENEHAYERGLDHEPC